MKTLLFRLPVLVPRSGLRLGIMPSAELSFLTLDRAASASGY